MKECHKKVLSIIVENKTGVLNRIASLFRKRNFNIDSLTVARTEIPDISRMTIVLEKETDTEQISKQLYKLINILKVLEFAEEEMIARESLLLKVTATKTTRQELLLFAETFGAKVADISLESITFEFFSSPSQIERFIEIMRPFGLKEIIRSGSIAIAKEKK
jgi:acetolactate synthase I/III small subunit